MPITLFPWGPMTSEIGTSIAIVLTFRPFKKSFAAPMFAPSLASSETDRIGVPIRKFSVSNAPPRSRHAGTMATEPRYLLDTNICIFILDATQPQLRRRLEQVDEGALATSTIVLAELLRGTNLTSERERLRLETQVQRGRHRRLQGRGHRRIYV